LILGTSGPCCKSKFGRSESVSTHDQCQNHELDRIPEAMPASSASAVVKLEEITLESELGQVERMMIELELEGWHVVSREEVKDLED
jgi:hypothetical protein